MADSLFLCYFLLIVFSSPEVAILLLGSIVSASWNNLTASLFFCICAFSPPGCRKHQYSTVRYSIVRYSTVQYGTVQYGTVQYSTVRYSTVQYSTVQYSTVRYGTVQYSTVQYSTVQYSTVQSCISSEQT